MRPSWHQYFMEITQLVAQRSTCLRRNVGAILVKDRRILATGYNGAPRGIKHCSLVGCLRDGLPAGSHHELCRGIHAEQNAIIQAAYFGFSIQGSVLYSTHQPCFICTKMIINAGIKEIYYLDKYPDPYAIKMLEETGIKHYNLRLMLNRSSVE